MKKPPCIRGLIQFKKGCPQRPWDGENGCPAWIELSVGSRANPLQKEIRRQCIDLWSWEFQWAGLGIMEGVQQATESSRNMTALQSLVITNTETPEQLVRVASKHLSLSKQNLLEQGKNENTDS